MIRDRGEHFHAAFLPAFPFSPYWLIISPRGRLHQASINSPPQPLSSRAYPFPLLYLTCSSGSQQTVKGQKAEAWEHRKYSNHCLSDGFRLVFPSQEQSREAVLVLGMEAFLLQHHCTHFHQNTAGILL